MHLQASFILSLIILLSLLYQEVRSPPALPFCYITCSPASCGSNLMNTCNSCSTYFIPAGPMPNACIFDISLTTVKLSKGTADFSVTPGPRTSCNASLYQYYGEYGNLASITISSYSPVTENHYGVTLIVWMILFDQWPASGYVDIKLSGTAQNFSITQSSSVVNENYCFGGNADSLIRFSRDYIHTDSLSNIQFLVTSVSSGGLFAIGDIMLVAKLCHAYCTTCTGPTSTVCSACNAAYYLSNTECAPACLDGYGTNLPSNVCIVCYAYCLTCSATSTNCTVCRDSIIVGTNTSNSQIYKVEDQNSCVVTCPAGYYPFITTKKCLSCALHCVTMTITSQLVSSNASLQFLYTFTEAIDFATFTYTNFLNFSSSNASINANTDFNVVYQAVDTTHFKLTLTPKPYKYLVNNNFCTNILPEASNPYQYSTALNKLSPTVYTSTNCIQWSTPMVNMTITSQVDVSQTFGEFLFTFTSPMDFSNFSTLTYTDFVVFNATNATLDMINNFVVTFTQISTTSFKLKLAPKPKIYFTDTTFCATTKAQASTSFQFSSQFYKLSPSVYGAFSCIFFSTPKVNMSITSQVDVSQTFGEFLFTFTSPMDFSNFSTLTYTDFVVFNASYTTLDMVNNFTVTFTQISTTSFVLKLAPKPKVYFTNTTFCATTKAQASTSFQFSSQFYKLSPSVYGAFSCILFSTPKVNLSLSNQLDPSKMFADFIFVFTAPMNFTAFVYSDFVVLNQSDLIINLSSNFTILFTAINDTSFKLTLKPNLGLYFVNTTFCATTKAQALTSFHFSRDLYKLDVPVYGQESCLIWSMPTTNMTISSQLLLSGASAEFTFTFDSMMDFTAFSYTSFLQFVMNISTLNLTSDFTIVYSQVDDYSFKMLITPPESVQFKDLNFCASTNLISNSSLQISKNNFTLSPTVYGQTNCLLWTTPYKPPASIFTVDDQKYYKKLQTFNNHLQDITTQKGTQQIIKSGAFAFFMPGAQLSSTVLLHQPRISQNLYEGSRFWGSFVFFEVPPYDQNSNKTKYTFSQPDKDIANTSKSRRLQQLSSQTTNFVNQWKFDRTGHTGFFIFDTYIQMLMIAAAWIFYLVVLVYEKRCSPQPITLSKLKARVMAFFHKIHQVSFFYLVLAALIEYRNLDTSSYLHTLSIVIASFFLCYYLVYELKVFYDMIGYPKIKIGTRAYQDYVQKYGIFLAYYRFQEYNDKNQWNWRHFFRPYNYQTLTFVKKALMLTAVVIFYEHGLSAVIILTVLQTIDVVRFLLTLPYHNFWRNLFYFGLQGLLFIFFLCSLINQVVGQGIMDSNGIIVDMSHATTYRNSGWVGMIVLFLYNILYVLSSVCELGIILFTKSSLENMTWANRNAYYQDLYEHFETYGSYYRLVKNYTDQLAYNRERREVKSFKGWVNKFHDAEPLVDLSQNKMKVFREIVQRGNIFTTEFQENEAKDSIEIKIQQFKVKDFQRLIRLSTFSKGQITPKHEDQLIKQQTQSSPNYRRNSNQISETKSLKNLSLNTKKDEPIMDFEIEYQILPQIFKYDSMKNKQAKNNLYIPKKIKNIIQSDALNLNFQKSLAHTLLSYQMPGTEQIKLSTFLRIDLKSYEQGQKIIYKREDMRQQILIRRGRTQHKIELKQLIYGFPVDWKALEKAHEKDNSSCIGKQIESSDHLKLSDVGTQIEALSMRPSKYRLEMAPPQQANFGQQLFFHICQINLIDFILSLTIKTIINKSSFKIFRQVKDKMRLIQYLIHSAKQVRQKVQSLYDKISDQDAEDSYSYCNVDEKNDMLRSTLKFSTYAPLIVYSYFFLYGLYSCYTVIKTIILVPIEVVLGILNIVLKSLKLYKSRYVTMHSLVVAVVAYIFTLDEDIFDISFMYHLIRGQSTVKVYAIIFAIESSEIVLTKLGVFLYQNIKDKLTNKQIPFYRLFPQFLVESVYVFCHAYVIYIDYLIYSVVLNSSLQSFVIFWSVVYLTKMKSAPTFGLDVNKYRITLTDDSKYRLSRVLFLILFLCNQQWDSIPSLGYKVLFILFFEEIFIICKHMLYLLSSYRGASDTSALELREDMYKTMYLNHEKSSVDRCVMQNFTVLPFSVFAIKIITVIIQSNWEPSFLAYLTFYTLLSLVAAVLIILIISIKSVEELAQQMRKKHHEPSPFINSICIDVIGRIIETGRQKQEGHVVFDSQKGKGSYQSPVRGQSPSQRSSEKQKGSPKKLKRVPSFLESLLLHANQIQNENQKKQQAPQHPLQQVEEVNEQAFLNQSNRSKNSLVELRKMQSHQVI